MAISSIKINLSTLAQSLPPNLTLLKAQTLVRRGKFDSAIKLYRGMLRLMPNNPKINSLLGELLIHTGHCDQAAKVLEIAHAGEPREPEHWIRLLAAHHRAGNLVRCREILAIGEGLLPKDQLEMFARGISQPPANRLDALMSLVKKKNFVSAEISARMFIEDFPEHPFGWAILIDVFNATGRGEEAKALLAELPLPAA